MTEEQMVRAILLWSALPGASRHHWGTEIDLIDRAALPPGQRAATDRERVCRGRRVRPTGSVAAAPRQRHGFFLPYDRDRGGVQPEPWHVSFAPVANAALPALTLEVLAAALSGVELAGATVVHRQLHEIHARYVCAVAQPAAEALAGERH